MPREQVGGRRRQREAQKDEPVVRGDGARDAGDRGAGQVGHRLRIRAEGCRPLELLHHREGIVVPPDSLRAENPFRRRAHDRRRDHQGDEQRGRQRPPTLQRRAGATLTTAAMMRTGPAAPRRARRAPGARRRRERRASWTPAPTAIWIAASSDAPHRNRVQPLGDERCDPEREEQTELERGQKQQRALSIGNRRWAEPQDRASCRARQAAARTRPR